MRTWKDAIIYVKKRNSTSVKFPLDCGIEMEIILSEEEERLMPSLIRSVPMQSKSLLKRSTLDA